jgi:hypothetical protein
VDAHSLGMHAPACAQTGVDRIGSKGLLQLKQARSQASHGGTTTGYCWLYWRWSPEEEIIPSACMYVLPRPHAAPSIARKIIEQFVTCHSPTAKRWDVFCWDPWRDDDFEAASRCDALDRFHGPPPAAGYCRFAAEILVKT